jgi:hypothetical protein
MTVLRNCHLWVNVTNSDSYGASSNPTQFGLLPPLLVAPYRFPVLSKITPKYEYPPSLCPVNLYMTVSVHTPFKCFNSNTVPEPVVPPPIRRAVDAASFAEGKSAFWGKPVPANSRETMENRFLPALLR